MRLLLPALLLSGALGAQVRLPRLISDSMILQRNVPVPVWGWATPGEKVTVTLNRRKYNAITAADGKWKVTLPSFPAGGPYDMNVDATNHLTVKDILFGDVWLGSGQSNMVIPMERVKEKYPEEIAGAANSNIRNFFIPTVADATKVYDDLPPCKWKGVTPHNVLEMGAVTYFFAKKIVAAENIPIGIINSSVGGTPIEAWLSEEGFAGFADETRQIAKLKDTAYVNGIQRAAADARRTAPPPRMQPDQGVSGPIPWYEPAYSFADWKTMMVPGYWADQGIRGLNGVVWFRKEIELPASMEGKPAKLFVGRIVDADQTYVNGRQVGNITYQYPPRRYEVPAGLLHAGKNTIVVRITNTAGKGGFVPDKNYSLVVGSDRIDLRGEWKYRVGQVFQPMRSSGPGGLMPMVMQNQPTGLYNTMIAPVVGYPLKGMIWYQGEANTGKAGQYQYLLPALIRDWRAKWGQGNLPFLVVQLPNFNEEQYSPAESDWAVLREGQLKSLSVPNTALAVTIDLGEWNDIHPLNKKDVGERLAVAAEKLAYGKDIEYSGPLVRSAQRTGSRIEISFEHTGTGLIAKGDSVLHYFAIAGKDKKFSWATAIINGDKVIVWNDDVPDPAYVRYAWADNPDGANLYNKEGLPASPFQVSVEL